MQRAALSRLQDGLYFNGWNLRLIRIGWRTICEYLIELEKGKKNLLTKSIKSDIKEWQSLIDNC